ncbi:MAG: hypothetical protein IMY77_00980 [Chloroflexi bacterium]|nr:hypothetical protein [Chloroflexota bacterium]
MRYMALKPWLKELEKCHDKVKDANFCDIFRSITVDSHQLSISIQGPESSITLDSNDIGWISHIQPTWRRDLNQLYNAHRQEFACLLDEIRMATDSVAEAVGKMLNVFTSDQVPDLVLRRMKGEQVDTTPVASLKMLAGEKLKELPPLLSGGTFESYEINLPVAGQTLELAYKHGKVSITWGQLSIGDGYNSDFSIHLNDLEQCLLLVRNFEAIKAKVIAFSDSLEGVQ